MAANIQISVRVAHSDSKLDLKVNLLPYTIGNAPYISMVDSSHATIITGYQLADLIDALTAIQGALKATGFDGG